jgi:hypothetical protein
VLATSTGCSLAGVVSNDVFDGEGKPWLFDPSEPLPVQQLRARMQVLLHPDSTENTYADWIARLIRHVDDEDLSKYEPDTLGDLLTEFRTLTRRCTRYGIALERLVPGFSRALKQRSHFGFMGFTRELLDILGNRKTRQAFGEFFHN